MYEPGADGDRHHRRRLPHRPGELDTSGPHRQGRPATHAQAHPLTKTKRDGRVAPAGATFCTRPALPPRNRARRVTSARRVLVCPALLSVDRPAAAVGPAGTTGSSWGPLIIVLCSCVVLLLVHNAIDGRTTRAGVLGAARRSGRLTRHGLRGWLAAWLGLGLALEQPLEAGKVASQRPLGGPQQQRLGQAEGRPTAPVSVIRVPPGIALKVRTPPNRRGPEIVLTACRRLGSYSSPRAPVRTVGQRSGPCSGTWPPPPAAG
jgi:hypothetical protein